MIVLCVSLTLYLYGCTLQQADCQKGAIFDGLTSQFISTQQTLAGLVLKATNNRKFIFFVNLSMTLEEIRQREKGIEDEKLRQESKEMIVLILSFYHKVFIYT